MTSSFSRSANETLTARSAFTRHDGILATRLVSRNYLVPLLLLLLCLGAYALPIRRLGFYWDDWPGMWVANSLSATELRAYVGFDRPVSGWLFSLTAPLIGTSALAAHVFALILRWMIAVAIWWICLGVWPESRWEAVAISMAAAVYPGSSQQSISWITSQGIYVPFLLCLVSIGTMLWLARRGRTTFVATALMVFAWSGSILHLLLIEYFFGLELLRPLLLWTALKRSPDRRARFFRTYLWYAIGLIGVLCWRMLLFRSARSATDQVVLLHSVQANPVKEIVLRVQSMFNDLLVTTIFAWTHAAGSYLLSSETVRVWWIGLLLLAASSLVCGIWLFLRYQQADMKWCASALGIAMTAIILSGLPVWSANRRIVLGETSDRYALAPMFGACIGIVALARWVLRTRGQQAVAVSLLVGLGVAYQYRSSERFALDWAAQRDLVWQLSWRVPQLPRGTSIRLSDESRISPKSDYAASIPINLLYAPAHASSQLDYWVFHKDNDDPPASGTPSARARTLSFSGVPGAFIEIAVPASGCLQVLADPNRLIASRPASIPQANIFGPEPPHGWCYYYEKAELARQDGDWATIARLGDEARARGTIPSNSADWQVFAEAHSRFNR